MKLNFAFNAERVKEIEKQRGVPIENCISDTRIENYAVIIMKAIKIDGKDSVGCSLQQAYTAIDEYLSDQDEKHDKADLMFDITEALVDKGFLESGLDVVQLRKMKSRSAEDMTRKIEEMS